MPDSNLSTSIAAVKTKITTDAPTATVDEILSLARAAKSVGLSEDAAVESAINSRVLTLSSGATTANMVKLANVIKQVRDATSSSGLTDISQLTDTTNLLSSGGGSSVTVSDNAPSSPSDGDMWFNSLDLKLYIRYNDGATSQWIIAAPAGPAGADSTVAGPAGPAGGDGRAGVYADMAALIAKTGMVAGDTALVTALNKVFMYTGSAWYLVATMVNDSPTAITGVDGSYTLATDGTATTITAVSTDPEGFPLTWSYAVTSGSLGSTATVSQADNVFTVTPSTNSAHAGNFSITFSVTDGATGAVNAVSAFTLSFFVANSRYTTLSVRATNTGSNQIFDDASTSNHTITVAGDTTTSTFSPYRHGGYSFKGDGTDDYLQIPHSTDTNLAGDFTIECWVYLNSNKNSNGLVSKWTGGGTYGYQLYATSSGVEFYSGNAGGGGAWMDFSIGSALTLSQWHHLVVSRTGSTISTYLNGTRTNTSTDSSDCSASTPLRIGTTGSNFSSNSLDGYLSNVRIVNGTGLYTGTTYTVPTAPLTPITNTKFLLGQLPYFKDQSTSNHTITPNGNVSLEAKSVFDNAPYLEASHGASAKIESSGSNRLTSPITAMGTGDFTVSGWVYTIGSNSSDIIFDTRPIASDASTGFYLAQYNAGYFYVGTAGNNFGPIQGTTNYPKNVWNHFAIVRDSSGNLKMYINGNLEGTDAIGTSKDLTSTDITIGSNRAGSSTCNAYVSDLKIESTAVYTTTFTPPTTPAVSNSNTTFLFNPEPAISDLSQSNLALDFYGNAAVDSTTVKFAGTKSFAFAGSGDYLKTSLTESIKILTDQFTVECWARRVPDTGVSSGIFQISSNAPGNQTTAGMGVFTRDPVVWNSVWAFEVNGTNNLTATAVPSDNVWYHVALVRDSNNLVTLYIDGTSVASSTATESISADYLAIGAHYGPNYFWPGNIQDFRITKGLARYTANFTPPTQELEG